MKADQKWKAWKDTFNPLNKNLERKTRLARGEDYFGAAVAAELVHSIVPATNPTLFHGETHVLPEGVNLADDFKSHFDNLATDATHRNEIFQGMLNQITRSSTSKHNEIKKILTEIKSALPSTGGRSNSVSGGGRNSAGRNMVSATQKETLNHRITQAKVGARRVFLHPRPCCWLQTRQHIV